MSANPDVVKLRFGLLGGFAIPQTLCAACGHTMVAPAKMLRTKAGTDKQGLALEFPLCTQCANHLADVDAVEGARTWRSFLLSLPLGIGAYAATHYLNGYTRVNWLTFFLLGLGVYTLIYLSVSQWLIPRASLAEAELAAGQVRNAVRMIQFNEAHSGSQGSITLEFSDHTYAHAFLNANATRVSA